MTTSQQHQQIDDARKCRRRRRARELLRNLPTDTMITAETLHSVDALPDILHEF